MNSKLRPLTSAPTGTTISIHDAVKNSTTLGLLSERLKESAERLRAVESMIPAGLLSAIQAGPIEDESWCLLVTGNSAAAKLRNLIPKILTNLSGKGYRVTSIRLKILITSKY